MPQEIDGFVRTLRDDPMLKRDFPDIEMGDLRWTATGTGPAAVTFSVTCLPAVRPAPPKPPPAAKAAK